ncbi:MAG: hypothetical protein WCB36_04730 [Burkholderiales bacterium]
MENNALTKIRKKSAKRVFTKENFKVLTEAVTRNKAEKINIQDNHGQKNHHQQNRRSAQA